MRNEIKRSENNKDEKKENDLYKKKPIYFICFSLLHFHQQTSGESCLSSLKKRHSHSILTILKLLMTKFKTKIRVVNNK